MRPRVGGGAVTTTNASPASGSTSRCIAPGLASGTLTLASAGSVMLRNTVSGSGGAWPRSAKVSVHSVPLARPSLSNEGICGRLRRMRIACPFSSGSRLTSPMMDPPLARIGSTSIGVVWSNTSHTVSARRNSAAGVGAAKENVTRRASLSRLASTEADLFFAPLSGEERTQPASQASPPPPARAPARVRSASALPPPRLASALPAARSSRLPPAMCLRAQPPSSLPRALRSRSPASPCRRRAWLSL